MIFGEGKDEEIKKYVDGVFAKVGFHDHFYLTGLICTFANDKISFWLSGVKFWKLLYVQCRQ